MKILQCLARKGRTIIQTIHQPNSEIFEIFDQLMLLSCGKTMYFNDKAKAVAYFAGLGSPCPELANPADYFMSIMSYEKYDIEADKS